jgi:hypothetical protein
MVKFLAIFLICLFIFVPTVSAQQSLRNGEVVTLEKTEVIESDYFASGEKVTVSGTVNGDAYVAGGNVLVDGVINGDLLVGAGNVNITGEVTGDVRAVGGDISISGSVAGNVSGVGGNINLENGALVLGSLVAAGGNVEVFGDVQKTITVGAGALTLGSGVGGNIVAGVGELDVTSNAFVEGDITYYSEEEANIAKEASVSGKITRNIPPNIDTPDTSDAKVGWNIFSFLTSLLVGILFILLAPNYTKKIATNISERPWVSLGVGILTLIITPVLLILLFATVIGIPLAILGLVLYLFIIFFGHVFTSILIGQKILKYIGQGERTILNLILGLLILGILGLIPVIGGLVSFIAMLVGVGSYVVMKKTVYSELRGKKTI